MSRQLKLRIFLGVTAAAGLLLVFLFQRLDLALMIGIKENIWRFIFNRSIRFILNDALAILLIYALFYERKYVWFAVAVQVFGLVFVLIPYFILKFNFPGYNGPLISFLHRLVLNPTLILLLIPAFYYQRLFNRK
ncbi:MAG TPA: exosortase F system-associated protein [Cyclobacteriaceae bacterium]|nr:exosortase F system-associated protein [Cyclobacteriaceae bacterium]